MYPGVKSFDAPYVGPASAIWPRSTLRTSDHWPIAGRWLLAIDVFRMKFRKHGAGTFNMNCVFRVVSIVTDIR